MNSRESIYAAVFTRLSAVSGLVTKSRRLRHIEDVQPVEFPAGFQTQVAEDVFQEFNKPPIYTIRIEWWIYVYQTDQTIAHSPQLNALVDAALTSLNVSVAGPNPAQTLGGIVTEVLIDGRIDYVEGVLDNCAFVRIPIVIKTPG